MAVQIKWQIEGVTELSRKLEIISQKVTDWTPAFQDTADTLKSIFSGDVFDTEGGAIEETWQQLSTAYAKRKAKKYPGKGILEATGAMKNGFLTIWNGQMAEVWNQATYFKYHQSNAPRTKMPRRVMMKLADQQREQIQKIFQGYYNQIISA